MLHVFRSAPLARRIVLAALFAGLGVDAQSPVASVTGVVTDSQGGRVPQATIQAIHTATGQTFRGVTNGEGDYSIPSLPIGLYEVTVQAPGFKTFRRTDIRLEVEQRLRLDIP